MPKTSRKTATLIAFEHPANEQIRLHLRLEYLFTTLQNNLNEQTLSGSKDGIIALLKILNVIDRPDLKSKLIQTLNLHITNLSQLLQAPNVDTALLQTVLQELNQHTQYLHNHQGKIGEPLRKNDFLTQIRLNLYKPAGACEHALPAYHLWLHKSAKERQQDLQQWSQPLLSLGTIVTQLLNLSRKSTQGKMIVAKRGFYRQDQDPSHPCKLLCVSVPSELGVFPEFSANKHRIHIRFLKPDIYQGSKPTQVKDDIEFELTCCRL